MMNSISSFSTQLRDLFLSPAARPLRFAGTGGVAGAVQLLLLSILTAHGWNAVLANGVAFLLAAQVNFALSLTVTWRDRHPEAPRGYPPSADDTQRVTQAFGGVPGTRSGPATVGWATRCWLLFHGSIAAMALVNMLTFAAARSFVPALVASVIGIAAGAVGNYLAGDRLVFRQPRGSSSTHAERMDAA
jgi:putative flippase GtrA